MMILEGWRGRSGYKRCLIEAREEETPGRKTSLSTVRIRQLILHGQHR